MKKPAIGIFGAGWVGVVTGACFADLGHEVVVRDIVPERVEALQAGRIPFHEPGLVELLGATASGWPSRPRRPTLRRRR